MRIAILSAILGCLSLNAEARIGETLAQCTARYGKASPVATDPGGWFFVKNGFCIIAKMSKGTCYLMLYTKCDAAGLSGEKITKAEIQTLMQANAPAGSTWELPTPAELGVGDEAEEGLLVETADKKFRAFTWAKQTKLTIFVRSEYEAWVAKCAAEKAAEKQNSLKGF